MISIHALLAESDTPEEAKRWNSTISIHALLAESDVLNPFKTFIILTFLSTLSLRRATCYSLRYSAPRWHFYPRSPCGERRYWSCVLVVGRAISIHALLAESDAPPYNLMIQHTKFLSTLSLRRATFYPLETLKILPFLSTLSLRRATIHYDNYNLHCVISIHALLAESDTLI